MAETSYLKLVLTPSSEWTTKKYSTFITELAGIDSTSSLQKIDGAIASLNEELLSLEDALSTI